MKAVVLISFSGLVLSASAGEEIEINDSAVYEDLVNAGYIAGVDSSDDEAPAQTKRRRKK